MGRKWKSQTEKDGEAIKAKIGEDTTVSILMNLIKLYTYGPNWGRGGEVMYQAFGLKMPNKLNELVKKKAGLKLNKKN